MRQPAVTVRQRGEYWHLPYPKTAIHWCRLGERDGLSSAVEA